MTFNQPNVLSEGEYHNFTYGWTPTPILRFENFVLGGEIKFELSEMWYHTWNPTGSVDPKNTGCGKLIYLLIEQSWLGVETEGDELLTRGDG